MKQPLIKLFQFTSTLESFEPKYFRYDINIEPNLNKLIIGAFD